LRGYDENLQLRALKTDYINVLQHIKLYTKSDVYTKFAENVKESFADTAAAITDLEEKQRSSDIKNLENIELKVKEVQRRLDTRMN